MNASRRIARCLALLLIAALPAAAAVTVSFPSESYTDIGPPGAEVEEVKNELARHLHVLDARYLAPGDSLWIEVLDVDLAGRLHHTGRGEIRVASGQADWPRIKVRYRLERNGKTSAGEDTVSDPSYLWFPSRARPHQSMPHEKRMLETWFKEKFAR